MTSPNLLPLSLAVFLLALPSLPAVPLAGKITGKIIEESVERAARRSGRKALDRQAAKAAGSTLSRLATQYGDEMLTLADDAGIEILEAIPTYGDDIVLLARQVSPPARRALALNIPELLPLAKRFGAEALEVEARSPGLATGIVRTFGDDAGKVLASQIPATDLPRLVHYAGKADSPATRQALLDAYQKEGSSLFTRIPPKLIMASGLSVSMIYGTDRVTEPLQALGKAIEKNPELAEKTMRRGISTFAAGALAVLALLLWRFRLLPWHGSKPTPPPPDTQRTGE